MTDFQYPKFNNLPSLPGIPRIVPNAEQEPNDMALFDAEVARQKKELDLSTFDTFTRAARLTQDGPAPGSVEHNLDMFDRFTKSLPPIGVSLLPDDPEDPVRKTVDYIRSVGRPASEPASEGGLFSNVQVVPLEERRAAVGLPNTSRGAEFLTSLGLESDGSNPAFNIGAGLVDRFLDVLDLSDVPNRVGFAAIHAALTGENMFDAAGKAVSDPSKAPRGADILADLGVGEGQTREFLGEGIDLVADWRNAIFGLGGATKAVKGARAISMTRNFIAEPMGALGVGMISDEVGKKIDDTFGTNIHGATKLAGQFLGAGVGGYMYERAASRDVLGATSGTSRPDEPGKPIGPDPEVVDLDSAPTVITQGGETIGVKPAVDPDGNPHTAGAPDGTIHSDWWSDVKVEDGVLSMVDRSGHVFTVGKKTVDPLPEGITFDGLRPEVRAAITSSNNPQVVNLIDTQVNSHQIYSFYNENVDLITGMRDASKISLEHVNKILGMAPLSADEFSAIIHRFSDPDAPSASTFDTPLRLKTTSEHWSQLSREAEAAGRTGEAAKWHADSLAAENLRQLTLRMSGQTLGAQSLLVRSLWGKLDKIVRESGNPSGLPDVAVPDSLVEIMKRADAEGKGLTVSIGGEAGIREGKYKVGDILTDKDIQDIAGPDVPDVPDAPAATRSRADAPDSEPRASGDEAAPKNGGKAKRTPEEEAEAKKIQSATMRQLLGTEPDAFVQMMIDAYKTVDQGIEDMVKSVAKGESGNLPELNPNSQFLKLVKDMPAKEFTNEVVKEGIEEAFDVWWSNRGNTDLTLITKSESMNELVGYIKFLRATMKGVDREAIEASGKAKIAREAERSWINLEGNSRPIDTNRPLLDEGVAGVGETVQPGMDVFGIMKDIRADKAMLRDMVSGDIREATGAIVRKIRSDAAFGLKLFDSYNAVVNATGTEWAQLKAGFDYLGVEFTSPRETLRNIGKLGSEGASKEATAIFKKVNKAAEVHLTALAKETDPDGKLWAGIAAWVQNGKANAAIDGTHTFGGVSGISRDHFLAIGKVVEKLNTDAAVRARHAAARAGLSGPPPKVDDGLFQQFADVVSSAAGRTLSADEIKGYARLVNHQVSNLASSLDELNVPAFSKLNNTEFKAIFRENLISQTMASTFGSVQELANRMYDMVAKAKGLHLEIQPRNKAGKLVLFPKITAESLLTQKGRMEAMNAIGPLLRDAPNSHLTPSENHFLQTWLGLERDAAKMADIAILSRQKMEIDTKHLELRRRADDLKEHILNGGSDDGIAMDVLHHALAKANEGPLTLEAERIQKKIDRRTGAANDIDTYRRAVAGTLKEASSSYADIRDRLNIAHNNVLGLRYAKVLSDFYKRGDANGFTLDAKNTKLKQYPKDVADMLAQAHKYVADGSPKAGIATLEVASARLLPHTDIAAFIRSVKGGDADWSHLRGQRDIARAIMYNNLLSAIRTTGVNLIGTGATIGFDTAQAQMWDMTKGALGDKVAASRAYGRMYGAKAGVKIAWQAGVTAFCTGTHEAEVLKHSIDPVTGPRMSNRYAPGTFEKSAMRFIEFPSAVLQATDAMLHQWVYMMNMGAEAAQIATLEKLTGRALDARVAEIVRSPVEALGSVRGQRLEALAFKMANNAVFKGDMGRLGQNLEKMQSYPGGRWLMPFLRTVYHITARGVDYVPGLGSAWTAFDIASGQYGKGKNLNFSGLGDRQFNQDALAAKALKEAESDPRFRDASQSEILKAKGIELTETPTHVAELGGRLRRNAAGLAFLPIMMGAYESGFLTGAGPNDPQQQAMLRADGWMPYSIRIVKPGGVPSYVSYANWGPFAFPFAMYAAAGDADRYGGEELSEKVILRLLKATFSIFSEQPYLQGITQLVGLMDQNQSSATAFNRGVASIVGNYVPTGYMGLMNQVGQATDKTTRKVNYNDPFSGTVEHTMARLPFLREQLAEGQDVLGNPVKNTRSLVDGVTPEKIANQVFLRSQEGGQSPIVRELLKYNVNIPPPPPEVGGIPLTFDEKQEFQRLIGDEIEAEMGMVMSGGASGMDPDSIQTMYRTALRKAGQRARKAFISTMGDALDRRQTEQSRRSASLANRVAEVA